MIRVHIVLHHGHMMIDVHNHGRKDVCLAVSALVQAAAMGINGLQKLHPDQIELAVEENIPAAVATRPRKKRKR